MADTTAMPAPDAITVSPPEASNPPSFGDAMRRVGNDFAQKSPAAWAWLALGAASCIACVVHGYKRSEGRSGDAFIWGLAGLSAPVAVPLIALYQGFGQPACAQPAPAAASTLDPHARARALLGG